MHCVNWSDEGLGADRWSGSLVTTPGRRTRNSSPPALVVELSACAGCLPSHHAEQGVDFVRRITERFRVTAEDEPTLVVSDEPVHDHGTGPFDGHERPEALRSPRVEGERIADANEGRQAR
jgi:hypothetical protein